MRTLSEITYNILNILRTGHSTNSESYAIPQIEHTVNYYRELLLRRDLSVKPNMNLNPFIQDLGKFDCITVTPSDLTFINTKGLDPILTRTKDRIPDLIRNDVPSPLFVQDKDFRLSFPVIELSRARWRQYDKFTSEKPSAFVHDNYVYLHSSPLGRSIRKAIDDPTYVDNEDILEQKEVLNISGVFSDPRKAIELKEGRPFNPYEDEYPISGDFEQRITQSLLSGEFKVLFTPTDMLPNNIDESNLSSR